jgi:hypothetical protein
MQSKDMSKEDITKKLEEHLKLHEPMTEECHVVYLIAELRKILDRMNDNRYPVLRFYCDWGLHTEKSRNLSHIAPQIKLMYDSIEEQIKAAPALYRNDIIRKFYSMEVLRDEIKKLFTELGIPTSLVDNESTWKAFWKLFAKVLTDQPIFNPIPEVKQVVFEPSHPDALIIFVEFVNPIKQRNQQEQHWFRIGLGGI